MKAVKRSAAKPKRRAATTTSEATPAARIKTQNSTPAGNRVFTVGVDQKNIRIPIGTPGPIAKRLNLESGDVLEIKPTEATATAKVSGPVGKSKLTRTVNADITTTQSVKGVIRQERGRGLIGAPKVRGFARKRKSNLFT